MSAITLRLGRRYESAELHLHLPADSDEIREKLTWLDDYAEDLSKPVELRDVDCEIVGIRQYLRQADLSREGELNSLNALARKIEGMDWWQKDLLWGALDCESISSLDDVLRVADHLDQYELLGDIRNDRDLGFHLVETGWKQFPDSVLPYLDYAAIGLEYRSKHAGSFNGGGYVRKKDMEPRMEAEQKAHILTVRLSAPGRKASCSLKLPASDSMLEQVMRTLSISKLAEADIHVIEDYAGFMRYVDPMDRPSVETLNELAWFVSDHLTTDGEWIKFEAVCEAARASTWQEMLDLARDLDNYKVYEVNDPEDLGGLLAEEIIEAGGDITVEMEDFITYDYRGFGLQKMKEDGIRDTHLGYVRRLSEPFPNLGFEQTIGQL